MASQPRERSRSRGVPRDPLAVTPPEVRPATNMDVAQLTGQVQDICLDVQCHEGEVRALSDRIEHLTDMMHQALDILLLTQRR